MLKAKVTLVIDQPITIEFNHESNFPVGSDEWTEEVSERIERKEDGIVEKIINNLDLDALIIQEIGYTRE